MLMTQISTSSSEQSPEAQTHIPAYVNILLVFPMDNPNWACLNLSSSFSFQIRCSKFFISVHSSPIF